MLGHPDVNFVALAMFQSRNDDSLRGCIVYMYLAVACSLRGLDDDFDPSSSESFFQHFDLARGVPPLCHDTTLYSSEAWQIENTKIIL